jgi:hypothetical protein
LGPVIVAVSGNAGKRTQEGFFRRIWEIIDSIGKLLPEPEVRSDTSEQHCDGALFCISKPIIGRQ